MNSRTFDALVGFGLLALVFALTLGVAWGISAIKCNARWTDSGMEAKFGLFVGCRVSDNNGKTWIPEDRWRKVDE